MLGKGRGVPELKVRQTQPVKILNAPRIYLVLYLGKWLSALHKSTSVILK
jgi:hypothetical protein